MTTLGVEFALLVTAGFGLVLGHLSGRKAGRRAYIWRLRNDDAFGRQALVELARCHGARVDWKETDETPARPRLVKGGD